MPLPDGHGSSRAGAPGLCAACGLVSDPDLYRKLAGFADVTLSTLTFLVEQSEELNPRQLAACEVLQAAALAVRGLALAEALKESSPMSHWKTIGQTTAAIAEEMLVATSTMASAATASAVVADRLVDTLDMLASRLQRGESISDADLTALVEGLPVIRANQSAAHAAIAATTTRVESVRRRLGAVLAGS